MKKRILFCFILLCLTVFLFGCHGNYLKEGSQLPEVSITVVRDKNEYAPCSLLLDPDYCRQLEEKLSIRLQIQEVSYTGPFREDVEITFTGGLVTSNCLWMIPKSSGYQLEKMNKSVGMKEPQYGRLGTIQYSYVFSDRMRTWTILSWWQIWISSMRRESLPLIIHRKRFIRS